MKEREPKLEIGSKEWFVQRAFEVFKPATDGVWDFSDSAVLYTPEVVKLYEALQQSGNYQETVTSKETELIRSVASEIVEGLPDSFTYVDLGPGTEGKERFFQDAIKEQGKNVLYAPVDISKELAVHAKETSKEVGLTASPIVSTFEGLPENHDFISLPEQPKFVSLGLTFTNYKPEDGLELLGNIAGKNGISFVTVQLRDRIDMEKVRQSYVDQREFFREKLRLLGVNPETDIGDIEVTDEVEMYCAIKVVPQKLREMGVKVGDKILLWRSLRYTVDSLKRSLEGTNFELHDPGLEFTAATIRH